MAASAPRLLEQVRERLRLKHCSLRTEQVYVQWIKRCIVFNDKSHPAGMGKREVEAFPTSPAVERNVSASTRSQALSSILFLYREVLAQPLPWRNEVTRAKRPARLPSMPTKDETRQLLEHPEVPLMALVVQLLYGTGMRLLECLRLRVKDVDFARREVVVREGKGGKDRMTMLPASLLDAIRP